MLAERGDHVAGAEDQQREDEQPALAEHVAEPARDRRRDRRGEQVAGQHPRDAARVRVELLRQLPSVGISVVCASAKASAPMAG